MKRAPKILAPLGVALATSTVTYPMQGETRQVLAMPMNQEHFGSLMVADENMEVPDANESTHFYAADSAGTGLTSSGDAMFANAGTMAIAWDFPVEKYGLLNRLPVLVGTATTTTNRAFALQYYPTGHQSSPANHYWTFGICGTNSTATQWACTSDTAIPNTVRRIVAVPRIVSNQLRLDILDLDSGTWYRGTAVAKPSGWAGVDQLTYPVTIAGARNDGSYSFPANFDGTGNNAPNANPSARGSFSKFLIADTELSDGNIEAIYRDGADAVTIVGSGDVRFFCPLATDGAKDLTITSNQSALSGDSMVQDGVAFPGPTVTRQGAVYITLDSVAYPGALVRGDAVWQASGKAAGVSGQAQYRYVGRDGQALTGWNNCAHTLASGDLTVDIAPPPNSVTSQCQLQLRFTSHPDVIAATHSDIQAAAHIVLWSQSEGLFATTQGATNTGANTTLNVRPSGETGTIAFVDVDGNVRATKVKPGLLGDAGIALANYVRDHSDIPVVFAQHQISGTSRRDLMDDSKTARQWADETAAHEFVLNRTVGGAVPVTAHIDVGWESSDNVAAYGREVLAPWLTGAAYTGSSYTYGAIDHYLRDGTFTEAPYYMMPANRSTVSNASASTTTDASNEADQRDSQRNWGHLLDYEIGPETTAHSMEGESGGVLPSGAATHPVSGDLEGSVEMAEAVAQTALLALGAGTYPGAVFFEAIGAGSAANKVIVQIGSGRADPGANLANPDTGYDLTGFAMPTDLSLITKAIDGNARWAFEAKIDDAGDWDIANVTAAEIVSATRIELTLSSNYVDGETSIRHRPGTPGSYRDTTVSQTDWRAGQLQFVRGSERFLVASSNQALVLGSNPTPVADSRPVLEHPDTPPLSAPAFTTNSISGTPGDGETLTANYTATGNPTPTASFQWQRNGTDIDGEDAATLVLDASADGWVEDDTISCEITLTNSQGSASAEPTATFLASADPIPAFLSLISGSSESGFFDGREATGSGDSFALADQNGGAGFTSGLNLDPTISGTNGLEFEDETTQITRAQAAGNYTIVLRLTKDVGHGDVSAKFLIGNVGIYEGDNAVSSPGATTFVDGLSAANRQAFYNAINSGAATVMFTGVSAAPILIGRNGLSFNGSILGIAIIREADFPSSLADVQDAARAAVEAL